jgi:type II secretory pathway pseudopilin PulG
MLKQQKGITLITLVITIVILIILAGVAISLTLSDNGLFSQAKKARDDYKVATNEETDGMANVLGAVNELLK